MSELDFEVEVNENKAISTRAEQTSSVKSKQDQSSEAVSSEMSQDVQRNSEEGEVESDTGEVPNSDGELADLEEGEINDENTDGYNVICRFFQSGNCRFGKQCRFLHIGASAYKMFESRIFTKNLHFATPSQHVYYTQNRLSPPLVYPERKDDDPWEQGLEEAKKLLLIARDKKETDVEFEDKKLYLQTEKETVEIDRRCTTQKEHFSDKKKKKHCKSKANFKSSPPEFIERETKLKKQKKHSKSSKLCPEIWTDPWRRSRSRTRNRSRSSSSSSSRSLSSHSSRHWTPKSSCSSLCSFCSSDDNEQRSESKVRASKGSKLQRVFSRTFSRSRSRRRSLSCSRSRSKSRAASLKRSLYRSYSRSRSSSSSASWYSKKNSIQKVLGKSKFEQPSSNVSKILHSPKQHKRKLSPDSPISNRRLKETASSDCESFSSDLTVSSITCTTFSGTRSSVDSGSVKRAKVTSNSNSYNKRSAHSDELLLEKYQKTHSVRETTNDKSKNEKSANVLLNPKSSDKITPDTSAEATSRKISLKKDSPVSNKKLDNNQIPTVKKTDKRNISDNELLRYLPTKNRRPAEERKEKSSAKSTETMDEPKKVISITLKPKSKFVPTKSLLSSPVPVHKSPPKPMSRREQLLRQLEAVELAIAKKKKLV